MSATPIEGTLARETNWWGAFVIGLAGTILVIGLVGFALVALGGFAIVLFAVLTAVGVVLCFCLAELAAAFPERAGGLPAYSFETFKPLGANVAKHVGGLSSWGYWLGWFTVAPINAYLAAVYINDLLGINSTTTFGPISTSFGSVVNAGDLTTAMILLVVMFAPCWLGTRLGARFATILGVGSIVPLVLLVVLPFFKPSTIDFGNLDGLALPAGVDGSWQLILGWAFIFTWTVLAMEAAACYIGECRDPARDAKIALTAEGLFGFFIYLSVPIMILAVLGADGFTNLGEGFIGDASTLFNGYVAAIFGTSVFWKWFVGLALILALLLSVLNAIMGASRGLWQNSHDGILPRVFGRTNKHGSPSMAMLFSLACSMLVLTVGSPLQIYIFSNMGYLFAVAMALIGYGIYRARRDDMERPLRMPSWFGPLGFILGVALFLLWVIGGYVASDYAVGPGYQWLYWVGLILLAVYFPLYFWRMSEDRKLGIKSYSRATGD